MTRDALVVTAAALKPASAQAATEYADHRERMVGALNARMLARPDLEALVGPDNREMMADNHANHARFIQTILAHHDPEVLVDSVLWVFRAYRSHGFQLTYWSAQLNAWIEILGAALSPAAFAEVRPLYEWLLLRQPAFVALTDASAGVDGGP